MVDEHSDRGYGASPVCESGNARNVTDALSHFDGDRLMRNQRHFDWAKGHIAGNPKGHRKGEFLLWSAAL